MTTIRRLGVIAILACVIQLILPELLMACPTCKNGLHADGTAAAYAFSILFMMGMPFVITTFWVTTILRLRSAKSTQSGNRKSVSTIDSVI